MREIRSIWVNVTAKVAKQVTAIVAKQVTAIVAKHANPAVERCCGVTSVKACAAIQAGF
jgi:hypothetical protein